MKVFVYGSGGQARVVVDALFSGNCFKVTVADSLGMTKREVLGIDVYDISEIDRFSLGFWLVALGDNGKRMKWQNRLASQGALFPVCVHSSAVIAKYTAIGDGTVVLAGAVVNAGARVGKGCILNTRSVVEHDCHVGDWVHISPGAKLGGNVSVGDLSWIGIGASIRNGVTIGCNSIVGAGAVVVKDVPDGVVVVGNPAKILRNNECQREVTTFEQ
ncbi:MAG: NeuD/PglB/VioB family sugar acetyltransferase [Negativicutes bacterium]|nr:NeuD/PglB/VioB family sugar acetyltransferase [Negativicutes bacterium]